MDLFNLNENLLTCGWIPNKIKPPQWCATFVVKATLKLKHDGVAEPAGEPAMISGSIYTDDDPTKSLVYESDFAPMKPKADILLAGSAHAPGGQPAAKTDVTLKVGSLSKTLTVHGPRKFTGNMFAGRSFSPTEPFVSVPLTYENAFGGSGYAKNPVGRGYGGEIAPQIEDPRKPITGPRDSAEPAGFGPLTEAWPQRKGFLGTYGGNYMKTRWPWFPENFNWSYFNAAPLDQQAPYLRGDETIELHNLHPKHSVYRTRLPGLRARAYVEEVDAKGQLSAREVDLKLDTLWIHSGEEKAILIWRGATDIRSKKLREVTRIVVLAEPLNAPPRTPDATFAMITAKLAAEDAAFDAEFVDPTEEAEAAQFDKEMAEVEKEMAEVDAKFAEFEAEAEAAGLGTLSAEEPGMAAFLAAQSTGSPAPRPTADELMSPEFRAQNPELAALLDEAAAAPDPDEEFAKMSAEIDAADPWPDPPEVTRDSVIALAVSGGALVGLSMAGLDLSKLQLAKLDFSNSDLSEVNLAGSNLMGANLSGADLSKADLSGADLTGANLSDADLDGATLAGAKMTKLIVKDLTMTKVDLAGADLSEARGEGADFSGTNFEGAIFRNAHLPRADFSKCKLAGANFVGATLADADFDRAQAPKANFEKGDLKGFRGSDANFQHASFAMVNAPGAIFDGSNLDGASFLRAKMPDSQLPDTSCKGTSFDRAVLVKASFQGANLVKANLSNANLLYASFDQADLSGADLRGSNLYGAGFWESILEKVALDRANVKNTTLA